MFHTLGATALHAHLLLCPKGVADHTKKNLWFIFAIDTLIAVLYHINIVYFEVTDEYTNYFLTEIWIRPTITYGLVACFVADRKEP